MTERHIPAREACNRVDFINYSLVIDLRETKPTCCCLSLPGNYFYLYLFYLFYTVYTRSWFGIVSHILCGLYCVEVLTTWTLDFDECRYSRMDTVVECRYS